MSTCPQRKRALVLAKKDCTTRTMEYAESSSCETSDGETLYTETESEESDVETTSDIDFIDDQSYEENEEIDRQSHPPPKKRSSSPSRYSTKKSSKLSSCTSISSSNVRIPVG